MKDLTVIIPIHKFDDEVSSSLLNAIDSVVGQIDDDNETKIMVVSPNNIVEKIKNATSKYNIDIVSNDGDTDFCTQINVGAKICQTKYFSILEYDDAFYKKWFKNAKLYMDSKPEYSLFLPLTELHLHETGELISFTNSIIWANSFSNEIGVIDAECLNDFYDFNMTGGIFLTEDFLNIGGLKPSIKLSFWYEFLLRATYNGINVYVIPKYGYTHMIQREGSLMDEYSKTINQEEASLWYELAKREYPFKEDRKKTPEKKNNEIDELK